MKRAIELDLLIVGAGPAGVAAATQAFRDGLAAALVTATRPGGMLWAARTLTNLPGFDHPLTGPILAKRLLDSLRSTGLPVITGRVVSLTRQRGGYLADLSAGARVRSRAVILATGTKPLPVPFPGWQKTEDSGRGHRDASTLPDRMTGLAFTVVGGGDVAFDTALAARDRGADPVTILVRGSEPRAAMHLQAEARSKNLSIETQTTVRQIQPFEHRPAGRHGGRLRIQLDIRQASPLVSDHVAICIGRRAADELLTQELLTGELSAGTDFTFHTKDSREKASQMPGSQSRPSWQVAGLPPGLWIAGDLASRAPGRFVAWALGSGQQAASRAAEFLQSDDTHPFRQEPTGSEAPQEQEAH